MKDRIVIVLSHQSIQMSKSTVCFCFVLFGFLFVKNCRHVVSNLVL